MQNRRMVMSDELGRICKETVLAFLLALPNHPPACRLQRNPRKIKFRIATGEKSNRGPPEYPVATSGVNIVYCINISLCKGGRLHEFCISIHL
jgi:hypothetical protein